MSPRVTVRLAAMVLVVAAVVGVWATGVLAGGRTADATGEACSASSLPPARPVAGLPPAVASMRLRIVAAARRCDYAELVRLGNEIGRGLQFSYGGTLSAPRYWRLLERGAGPRPRPLEALVKLLAMPFAPIAADGRKVAPKLARFYVWPSAHRQGAGDRDWAALRGLYTQEQIRRMRRDGSHLGYRVGITPCGDWQFFVAGD